MNNVHRLSISTVAFLIGLGSSPIMAQTATDTSSVTSSTAATTPSMTGTLNQNVNNDSVNSKAIDRMVDQDLSQQNKIEHGLKDGQLTTAEGTRLERGEALIDHNEAKDLNNGALSHQETAQLRADEYGMDGHINKLENNGSTVSSGSNANNRLIADVQRNINQEQRIDKGVDKGNLTASEVSKLESGQARDDRADFRSGDSGTISANEQQGIRADEKAQGMNIRDDRHNSIVATGNVDESMSDHDQDRDRDRYTSNRSDNDDTNNSMGNINDSTRDQNHDRDHDRDRLASNRSDNDNRLDRTHDFDHNDRMHDRFDNGDQDRFQKDDHNIDQTNDHDRDDMNHHRFTKVGDKDDHGTKGHWSWDHKQNANVAGQAQIGGTAGMSNIAAGTNSNASVNGGSSTSVAASNNASTAAHVHAPVTHVNAPVVTPHVTPPHVTHIPMAHSK